MSATASSSVDQAEIEHFARDSGAWWDPDGPFRPLHKLNPTRISYIKQQVCRHFSLDNSGLAPFRGLSMLDIGCGGGLACEPLARLGATVTGIDADAKAITVAQDHAKRAGLNIHYQKTSAEDLLKKKAGSHDVVLALEIIEHVTEPTAFAATCARLCKPGGLVIFSTLNRTKRSFAIGVVAAEYVLGWVSRGTHDWRKFLKPSELARQAREAQLSPRDVTGLVFNPVRNSFALSKSDLAINYFLTAEKRL